MSILEILTCKSCGSIETIERPHEMHGAGIYCKHCDRLIKWKGKEENKDKRKDKNTVWRKQWRKRTQIYKCEMCGVTEKEIPGTWQWHCDHIITLESGGIDAFENTRMVCIFCHTFRHNQIDFVKAIIKGVGSHDNTAAI